MKTPKAKKLPSGSWFVRVRVNGQDIGITRKTEKEAIAEAMAVKAGIRETVQSYNGTLRGAIDEYIQIRKPVLSPATIRGYRIIQNNRFRSIMDRPLSKVRDTDFQKALNLDLGKYSAKTMRNSWGFVASVLKEQAGRTVRVSLPQIVREEREFLQPEQIPVFIDAIRDSKHEIALLLGLHGLRASEILAVRRKDIDLQTGTIAVHGSAVLDENNKLQQKETNKNASSRRTVPILIPRLREAVEECDLQDNDLIFVGSSSSVLHNAVTRACKKADLPLVGVHGLRHSFASLAFHLGIPEETTMRLGGWSDFQTMRKIYTHLAEQDVKKHTDALKNFFKAPN